VCASFDDEAGAQVRVSMLNKTSAPIYIGQDKVTCSAEPLFQVAGADGAVLPSLGGCRAPCSAVRKNGGVGCPDICLFPTSAALQPGELLYTSWDGLFLVQGNLPKKCQVVDEGEPSIVCDQAKRIQPGTFTFSARAGTALDCSQTTGNGGCSMCMSDGSGACATPGSLISGTILTAEATVALDARYGVYDAPSAGSSPGAADAAPIEMLTVELVFMNQCTQHHSFLSQRRNSLRP